jgi:predicted DNA-binding protein YlxM (UPF0122 family)
MNKEKIKKQNNLLIYLGLFVAVSLIIAAVLRVLTPQADQVLESDFVIENYDRSETTFKKVVFMGDSIEVPKTFPIYRPLTIDNQADRIAEKIIQEYSLVQHVDRDNYWIAKNYNLINRKLEHEYVFYDLSKSEIATTTAVINLDDAVKSCENFFKNYDIDLDMIAQTDETIYLGEGLEPSETTIEKAVEAQIPFTQIVNSYPVFYLNEKDYPFHCAVDQTEKVKDFIFKDLLYKFEEVKELDSISLDKAVNNISKGKASIISAQSQVAEILDLTYIQRADLESVEIDYRYDNELKILYPFYHFQADIINIDGLNIKAEIITPAVNSAQEQ